MDSHMGTLIQSELDRRSWLQAALLRYAIVYAALQPVRFGMIGALNPVVHNSR